MTPEDIKDLRSKTGLSVRKFAKQLGVSPASIFRWETGKTTPLPVYEKKLERLAKRATRQS